MGLLVFLKDAPHVIPLGTYSYTNLPNNTSLNDMKRK